MNKPAQPGSVTGRNGLTVYEASAGSGKTYTLTLEYLKQALSDNFNAGKFRTVLAVTFTNKATDEMKVRIITALNRIAGDGDSDVADSICRELNIDRRVLKDRAEKVQKAILHDYSSFSISTIDKFFQKVLHAFVREAGLRPGFRLELDQNRLIDEAVDRMMLNLHKKDFLYRHALNIIDEQMEKGNSWDIRRILKNRSGEVLKEQFRALGVLFHAKISDMAFMERYSKMISESVKQFENSMSDIGSEAMVLIGDSGLEISDFKYGATGPVNYFYKLQDGNYDEPGKRVFDILDSGDNAVWMSKSAARNDMTYLTGHLSMLLKTAVGIYRQYCTALCIKRSMDILGFFAEIETNMHETAIGENLMPISETTHLLGKLINESDAPFIYEMTGSRYGVFMIDEFQDTSEAQWQNFKPLLQHSLSEGKSSLVVGDVKQSIYRWRNGDWRILAHRIFSEFGNFSVTEKNLDTNWRSSPRVIEFNNALFSALPAYIEEVFTKSVVMPDAGDEIDILSSAYKNAEQKIAKTGGQRSGYVSLSLIRDEDEDGEKIKAKDKILQQLPGLIADMQDRGYRARDIAILVRKASDGQEISDCLLNYGKISGDTEHCFDIVSKDALSIKKSATVQFIISLMRTVANPDDGINNASINYFLNRNNPDFKWNDSGILDSSLKEKLSGLASLSLPEVFEHLVRVFDLGGNSDEVPCLQELHDMIVSFANSKISDISSFVEHWDDAGENAKLSEGQTPDAISIVTVHRAKGLEYPAVIIPFCNWSMKPSWRDTVWVSPEQEPFNQLPYALVNYGKEMKNSHFSREYYCETVQSLVDNLNLMYVAFTRAKDELHVMLPLPKLSARGSSGSTGINTASSAIASFLKSSRDFMDGKMKSEQMDGDDLCYTLGEKQSRQRDGDSNAFSGIFITDYNSSIFNKKLRLKYESEDYFSVDTPLQSRNYGILMHRVFSLIRSTSDVPAAVERMVKDGLIGKEHVVELESRVGKALRFAGKWFADESGFEVVTEKSLLLPASMNSGLSRRPDRIMLSENETVIVDFKFGALKKDSHKRQIKSYIRLLEMMKYPGVRGYVWYVDMDSIEEITK
ncbi:MAG: UvrD-helicase domain-containing protein [Prevotellaceae bacterium]|jgi:ATP-dependent exoDNAse (exonuclease V) beta subunit|nr:UvrD-helicase domain-containing protein [Prevotellaceae bacterium]